MLKTKRLPSVYLLKNSYCIKIVLVTLKCLNTEQGWKIGAKPQVSNFHLNNAGQHTSTCQ